MSLAIKILKAGSGDSILINFDGKNILIDGGASTPYPNNLRIEILELQKREEKLDLVIATHFDEDHINGLKKLLEDVKQGTFNREIVNEFWFQIPPRISIKEHYQESTKIGVAKAKQLQDFLSEYNWRRETVIASTSPYLIDEKNRLFILSPNVEALEHFKNHFQDEWESPKLAAKASDYSTLLIDFEDTWAKKDNSISNGSSIAFLLEYNNQNVALFLGDAFPSIVVESLKQLGYSERNKLSVDYVKLSHHGSIKSISKDFLDIINCKKFIISTSGTKDHLPNKETFSKILKHFTSDESKKNISFLFNYEEYYYESIFLEKDREEFQFSCQYSNYANGLVIKYE